MTAATSATATVSAPADTACSAPTPGSPLWATGTDTGQEALRDAAAPFVREAAALASQVDSGQASPRPLLSRLGEAGLLDLGVQELLGEDPRAADVRAPAWLIAALARECMSTAFGLWAHRMVLDYLARGVRSQATQTVLGELRAGRRLGSTAMASGLKWLAGVGDLAVRAVPDGQGWRLTGFIPWASNLCDDSVVVLPASTPQGTVVVWVEARALEVRPVTGLLALNATASGTIRLHDVAVGPSQVVSTELASLAQGFKPTMLILQSAFCLGLAQRSLEEARSTQDRSANTVFHEDVAILAHELQRFCERWEAAAADTGSASMAEVLRLRLEAASLAGRATRLEATLAGGRGYQERTDASRRFREAAFLPVQSPSEGHLRWELSSLA
ncbi:acyl-CoA dehydrogenase [Actinomyces sp. 2119]|uniref:Acyl-CoA dehydrogenase n=1 Tax=Actinomyces lilanjuaniae TaxID=2321394 RepID=A0ABM6Z1L1_9ACTO|nr:MULTISPECIES: acyl-CoA dehydrogenase family protein [Actinomyces]AYD88991.1 acyl-CoA dehydrogenase [Actinomyces lilanjuaniae]RJF41157.1 acyl-CoA dehydrogenase [Actinomyces sp. 2119]